MNEDKMTPAELGALGGKARAESLTKEERSEQARRAVEARWEKAGRSALRATHGSPDRPLRIGALEIPCYVLENGVRVLSGRGMQTALGLGQGHGAILKDFLATPSLKPFIPNDLAMALVDPLRFVRPGRGGKVAVGFEATILADICDVILQARKAIKLTKRQIVIADQCEMLMRAFAKVGIIALVDEATGYQYDRPRRDLEEQLRRFLGEDLVRYVQGFPSDYFKHLCRLRGVELRSDMRLPSYFGNLTNDLVYRRIAPGLVQALKSRRLERGKSSNKLYWWTSEDVGYPALQRHLGAVVTLLKINDDYKAFYKQINAVSPLYPKTPGLFDNADDWKEPEPKPKN